MSQANPNIKRFSIAFSLPEHSEGIQAKKLPPGNKISSEIKFINGGNSQLISSMTNIPLQPQYDSENEVFFSEQNLFCQFALSNTSQLIVEFALGAFPRMQQKMKVRGILNLQEIVVSPAKPQLCIQLMIPTPDQLMRQQQQELSIFDAINRQGLPSNNEEDDEQDPFAELYLQFNIQKVQDSEYQLSELKLQLEYVEAGKTLKSIFFQQQEALPNVGGINNSLMAQQQQQYMMQGSIQQNPHQQYAMQQQLFNNSLQPNAPMNILGPESNQIQYKEVGSRPEQPTLSGYPNQLQSQFVQPVNTLNRQSEHPGHPYQDNQIHSEQVFKQQSPNEGGNFMNNYGNQMLANPHPQNNMSYANLNEGLKTNQISGGANDPQSVTSVSSPQPINNQSSLYQQKVFDQNQSAEQQFHQDSQAVFGNDFERNFSQKLSLNQQEYASNTNTRYPGLPQTYTQNQANPHKDSYPQIPPQGFPMINGGVNPGFYNGSMPSMYQNQMPAGQIHPGVSGYIKQQGNQINNFQQQQKGPQGDFLAPHTSMQIQDPNYHQQQYQHQQDHSAWMNRMGSGPWNSSQQPNMMSYQDQASMQGYQQQQKRMAPFNNGGSSFESMNSFKPGFPQMMQSNQFTPQGYEFQQNFQPFFQGQQIPYGQPQFNPYFSQASQFPGVMPSSQIPSINPMSAQQMMFLQQQQSFAPAATPPPQISTTTVPNKVQQQSKEFSNSPDSQNGGDPLSVQKKVNAFKNQGTGDSSKNIMGSSNKSKKAKVSGQLSEKNNKAVMMQQTKKSKMPGSQSCAQKIVMAQNQTSATRISGSVSKNISERGGNNFSGMMNSSNMINDCYGEVMSTASHVESEGSLCDADIPHLGDLVEYLCTQKGSRMMQVYLKKAPINSINLIIENINNNIGRLMCDSYANYFCQSLVRSVGTEQRLNILKQLNDKFVSVACDSAGTHSMQRLMEIVCEDSEKILIYNAICNDVERLAFHHKGNYVLLTILGIMRGDILTKIIDQMLPKISQLMLDQLGICLANKAMTMATDSAQIKQLIQILADNISATIQSPYGNYGITTALETWGLHQCEPIMEKIRENFAQYAMHKFSSNVIEKCVERADQTLIDQFKNIIFDGDALIMKMLLRSQHSFFIIQKIYNKLDQQVDREHILKLIHENIVHTGDKLIRSKCIQLINKGSQRNSGLSHSQQPQHEQPQSINTSHSSSQEEESSPKEATSSSSQDKNVVPKASNILDEMDTPDDFIDSLQEESKASSVPQVQLQSNSSEEDMSKVDEELKDASSKEEESSSKEEKNQGEKSPVIQSQGKVEEHQR